MTNPKVVAGNATGRPRSFTNDEAFEAVLEVIKKHGYADITMNSIAGRLECTGPALMARFGSKAKLLRAFMEWGNARSREHFDRSIATHDSPIQALRTRFSTVETEPSHEFGTNFNHVNIVAFHVAAWSDPQLHDLELERRTLFVSAITDLLKKSESRGEIAGSNPDRLGWVIIAAIAGAALQWNASPTSNTGCQIVAVIDELLRPYLVDEPAST